MPIGFIAIFIFIFGAHFSAALAEAADYERQVLPNGLTVIIKRNPDSRVFGVTILGKNRAVWEPPGKEGITDFVNRMLLKGTTKKSADQLQKALDEIGAVVITNDDPNLPYDDRYTWRAFSFIKFQTIDEFAQRGLEILSEVIASPSFPEEEIAKVKSQVLTILGMESGSPSQVCRNLYYATLFKNHPYAKPVLGTRGSVNDLTRDELLSYHRRYYAPQNLIIAVVSNEKPATVLKWVKKRFGSLPPYPAKVPEVASPTPTMGAVESTAFMDKEQVYIYLGNIACGAKSDDAFALQLAVEILSSRLKLNLREKQGMAYSVGADLNMLGQFGWYTVVMGTHHSNLERARRGILEEMSLLGRLPISEAELDRARNSLWGSSLMRNVSAVNQAYNMAYYEFIGLPYDFDDRYHSVLETVTVDDVMRAACHYLDTTNYAICLVGKQLP